MCSNYVMELRTNTQKHSATVTVNSVTIPYDSGEGKYISLSPTINVGDNVNLEVIKGSFTVSATTTMPEEPVIVSPTTAGGPYDPALALTVEWQSFSTEPDMVEVAVEDAYTASSGWYDEIATIGATTHDIPAGTLQSGLSSALVRVAGDNVVTDLGSSAAGDSCLAVLHGTASETFATQ